MYEYRISKLLKNSISILCNSKRCNARLSLAIDSQTVVVNDDEYFEEYDEKVLGNPVNYR